MALSEIYTVKDIQQKLNISRNMAYKLIKSGVFTVLKLGDTYRVSKVVFDKWLHHEA